ncbi:hypothetical protein JW968_04625 [Candidatus Woesearchaeota archaeon]|nr:hypothetical protein [Candidatus Woesearchaeota archaeon]
MDLHSSIHSTLGFLERYGSLSSSVVMPVARDLSVFRTYCLADLDQIDDCTPQHDIYKETITHVDRVEEAFRGIVSGMDPDGRPDNLLNALDNSSLVLDFGSHTGDAYLKRIAERSPQAEFHAYDHYDHASDFLGYGNIFFHNADLERVISGESKAFFPDLRMRHSVLISLKSPRNLAYWALRFAELRQPHEILLSLSALEKLAGEDVIIGLTQQNCGLDGLQTGNLLRLLQGDFRSFIFDGKELGRDPGGSGYDGSEFYLSRVAIAAKQLVNLAVAKGLSDAGYGIGMGFRPVCQRYHHNQPNHLIHARKAS